MSQRAPCTAIATPTRSLIDAHNSTGKRISTGKGIELRLHYLISTGKGKPTTGMFPIEVRCEGGSDRHDEFRVFAWGLDAFLPMPSSLLG